MSDGFTEIRRVLQWFSSARALINRPDRVDALRYRVSNAPRYQSELDKALQLCYQKAESGSDKEALQARLEQALGDYNQCMEYFDDLIQAARNLDLASGTEVKGQCDSHPLVKTRLPDLNLPKYSGGYETWMSFINIFDSLVHSRVDISSAQKLSYLLGCLSGEAHQVISHLAVTDDNYESARSLLMSRYQNIRLIADAHLAKILNLNFLFNTINLRNDFLNPLKAAYNSLEKLGLPVTDWSFILLHIILNKLPSEVKLRFEHRYGSGDAASPFPLFSDLLTFLEEEARIVDNMGSPSAATPRPSGRPVVNFSRARQPTRGTRVGIASMDSDNTKVQSRPASCTSCGNTGHFISRCPRFINCTTQQRRRFVQNHKLCYSCLGDHLVNSCTSARPCVHCGGRHHGMLCQNRNGGERPAGGRTGPTAGAGGQGRWMQTPPPNFGRASPRREDDRRTPPHTGGGGTGPAYQAPNYTGGGAFSQQWAAQPVAGGSRDAAAERYASAASYAARAASFSPPLAERPRLLNRTPVYGRAVGYQPPVAGWHLSRAPTGRPGPLPYDPLALSAAQVWNRVSVTRPMDE